MAEIFYGLQIRVKVAGVIYFQIPSGFPARTEAEVLAIIKQKLEATGYFDEMELKIEGQENHELKPAITTREKIMTARQATSDITIGTKERMINDLAKMQNVQGKNQ